MTHTRTPLESLAGIWVPLITPFIRYRLDDESVRRLVRHYAQTGITGFVLAGTTGEALTLSDEETARLVGIVQDENKGQLPVLLGLCGSNTVSLATTITRRNSWNIDGYLITAPYYTRPTQDGLLQHYMALADASAHPVALYNIPYRTCVNIENDTVFQLAEHPHIIGIKDCCAKAEQTEQLIKCAPEGFSVLVGDDANFFTNASCGAHGGILASAHIGARIFVQVLALLREEKVTEAKEVWTRFEPCIPPLFKFPNPAPLKCLLAHRGLISSEEVRLPLTVVPASYAAELIAHFEANPCF